MRFPLFLRAVAYFEPGAGTETVLQQLDPPAGRCIGTAWAGLLQAIPGAGNGRELRHALYAATRGKKYSGTIHYEQTLHGVRLRAAVPNGAALMIELRVRNQATTTYANLDMTLTIAAGPTGLLMRPFWQARLKSIAARWVLQFRRYLKSNGASFLAESPESNGELDAAIAYVKAHYPRTFAAFMQIPGGTESLRRIYAMNRRWRAMVRGELPCDAVVTVDGPLPQTEANFDIVYAGAGLGLVSAAVMATQYNRRIFIFDRYRPGSTHREWNICDWELQQLKRIGLLSSEEIDRVIAARYQTGVIEFFSGHSRWRSNPLWVDNVLDLAVEADELLTLCLNKIRAANNGSQVGENLTFQKVYISQAKLPESDPVQAVVETLDAGGRIHRFGARLVVDALGAGSPVAYALSGGRPYAGVCPTVGTVASGYVEGTAQEQVDPTLGEILISRNDVIRGRQLIWEGFPAGEGKFTCYLFYYNALAQGATADPGDLFALYEQYFTLLPSYKQAGPDFAHLKPVYGFIPSRARETPRESGATRVARSIVALGDSSAQQSPLTFCGFGSYVRNLERTCALIEYALRHNLLEPGDLRLIGAQQANVSLNWIFSRFMEPRRNRWATPNEVNEVMNLICGVIDELGPGFAQRFFKDRAGWPELSLMLCKIMLRYPGIWLRAATTVGIHGMALWSLDYLAFLREWMLAKVYTAAVRLIGRNGYRSLAAWCEATIPALWMRVEARRHAWNVADDTLEPIILP